VYTTLFSELFGKLGWAKLLLQWWGKASIQTKAVGSVVAVAAVTLGLGAIAVLTPWAYLSLLPLGIFYGVVLSYPITRFFGPKLQSLATGFLGGITIGNIGTQQAKLRAYIIDLGEWIKQQVVAVNPASSARAAHLDGAIVWAVWSAILICLAILGANAYYANKEGNPVGRPDQPAPSAQPAAPPLPTVQPQAMAQKNG